MKKFKLGTRDKYSFITLQGAEVTVTVRENDYLIKHGEITCQCPKNAFFISGYIDQFNARSSSKSQSVLTLGMNQVPGELALLFISLDVNELAAIQDDVFLKQYLDVEDIEESDCI